MAMCPCQKCLNNKWKIDPKSKSDGKIRHIWVKAICQICGFVVEFGHRDKPVPRGGESAKYKIKDGKRYLKIGRKYKEVYLKYFKDGSFKVMPVE
jgi:hypothetical protein